jgi:hypothetical protein
MLRGCCSKAVITGNLTSEALGCACRMLHSDKNACLRGLGCKTIRPRLIVASLHKCAVDASRFIRDDPTGLVARTKQDRQHGTSRSARWEGVASTLRVEIYSPVQLRVVDWFHGWFQFMIRMNSLCCGTLRGETCKGCLQQCL